MKINDMIEHNKRNNHHFFDTNTMKFWNSKIESELIHDKYFITSEDNFNRSKILYTVREYHWDTAEISDTIGFQKFKTIKEAQEYVNYLTMEAKS